MQGKFECVCLVPARYCCLCKCITPHSSSRSPALGTVGRAMEEVLAASFPSPGSVVESTPCHRTFSFTCDGTLTVGVQELPVNRELQLPWVEGAHKHSYAALTAFRFLLAKVQKTTIMKLPPTSYRRESENQKTNKK